MTILGVAMATVLITTLACIGTSILASVVQFLKSTDGTAHETYIGVEQENLKYFLNNQSFEEIWLKKDLDYFRIDLEDDNGYKYIIGLIGAEEGWFEAQGLKLVEGRFAERENEIVLPKKIRSSLGYDIRVGDKITERSGKAERSLFVVGFVDETDIQLVYESDPLWAYHLNSVLDEESDEVWQRYFIIEAYTYWDGDSNEAGAYDVGVRYKKSALYRRDEIAASLMDVPQELYEKAYKNPYAFMTNIGREENAKLHSRVAGFDQNELLESLEGLSPFHLTQVTVWIIAFSEVIFLFFVLAGVFCINNSFDISITERIRFYGMISSVGSTKRQRRMIVWMEAFVIGVFGIPLGILLGVALSFGLVRVVDIACQYFMPSLQFRMIFRVAWWAILIAVFQAVLMIALSAMESAFRAAKISPIEAIRSNDTISRNIALKKKQRKTPRFMKKFFGVGGGVAWQNFRRSKVKYRATIVSIAVSMAFLLGMTFIPFLFRFLEGDFQLEYGGMNYQVQVQIDHSAGYEKIKELETWDGVTKCIIKRNSFPAHETIDSENEENDVPRRIIYVETWDDKTFEQICKENNIDFHSAIDKGLISKRNKYLSVGEIFAGEKNNSFKVRQGIPGVPFSIEIAGEIDAGSIPDYFTEEYGVIVSESWIRAHENLIDGKATGYFTCKDANAFCEAVEKEDILGASFMNYNEVYQMTQLFKVIIYMFMIGFLFLVIAIGMTNVINAVNSNMEMRASEFAKLRAVGMTRKQFRGMIFAEGIFIAVKGLFWGYLFGCGIYYVLHRLFVESSDMLFADPYYRVLLEFHLPIGQMLAGAAVVVLLLYLVLNVHVKKVEKRNIIETIRNENI